MEPGLFDGLYQAYATGVGVVRRLPGALFQVIEQAKGDVGHRSSPCDS